MDKYYRLTVGMPWFSDEQPSEEIKAYVEEQLTKNNWKVDNEHSPYGFFADFEQARKYAVYVSKKYEGSCYIEKQLIFSEDTKADVIHRLSSNLSTDNETEFDMGYEGDENAIAGLFEDGSIKYIYSHELPEEEMWIEERSEARFEYRFIEIPFGMQRGMVVKMVDDGSYGVLAVGEKDWKQYLQEIEEGNLHVDYSDIQVMVYQLMENGHWSHQHINPLYLEPESPVVEEGNEERQFLKNALTALSLYLEEENEQNSEQVLQMARAYAEKKERGFSWARIVREAKSADDLLF
ncbi:MAG: hypothetical protein SOV61_00270 [Lachnospiraceae bacterium]|nr:hypothetical protein [Lachnospiraceae bacterium]MDY2697979.1 hypothetical protein [Lachnospiraceae bacterium]